MSTAQAKRPELSDYDRYLFNEGSLLESYDKLGAHLTANGTKFAVWAPNADSVSVVGDFNGWSSSENSLSPQGSSGIWEGTIANTYKGQCYKYAINRHGRYFEKADPYAFYSEVPPRTASVIWDISHYTWGDEHWLADRSKKNILREPLLIYEVHLGSWRRGEHGTQLSYREIASLLPDYVLELGFTHVELMPITEHPFEGSWGYQTTGYFAPTSRFGTPEDFMYLVDCLHQKGIGVILDWVPAHFPMDEFALGFFDGTHLYEHADWRQGFHPDWGTCIFNYGRHEVQTFLLSSAVFWMEKYHIDALRVDAVASMLYLDYSRKSGEWLPNQFGGRENIEAINFTRRLNETIYARFPGAFTVAEESTAWPMVSRPTTMGGLGFGLKWNMGWMNDTLQYFSRDSIYRSHHQNDLTFSMLYAFTENFILPLSHDEVVHGKGSLINRMPGDYWQKFAQLRLLFSYMYGHPGKKLIFMGGELAQWEEWKHYQSLDWHLLEYESHRGIQRLVKDLNSLVRSSPSLFEVDFDSQGFEWIDCGDAASSVFSFLRFSNDYNHCTIVVCNFTPVTRHNYLIGAPYIGNWTEVLNSDSHYYGGSGVGNYGSVTAVASPWHGRPGTISLTLPPLGVIFLQSEKNS